MLSEKFLYCRSGLPQGTNNSRTFKLESNVLSVIKL